MALTLVGCTEDYKDWTVQKPDTTPDAAIDVKATIEMASALDFNTYTEGTFQLFTPSVTSSVTADSIRYEAYMYNADKSESLPLNIDEEGKIASSEVFTNVQTLFGKRPQTYNVPIEVICRVYAGKSTAKEYVQKDTGITFADVAGEDEAKESLQEVVDFLHNPGKYVKIGAKLPKGALLVGPPGTGKTLLAKAVAGEAHVPFFSLTGSDFIELYVGVGASRCDRPQPRLQVRRRK